MNNMNELLILDIQEPEDEAGLQKPTKDIPTGKAGIVLGDELVKSSSLPEDIQRVLDQLGKPDVSE